MTWAAAAFIVLAFLALLQASGVVQRAGEVAQRSKQAIAVVRDRSMSDLEKEAAMQAHSKALFKQFLAITALAALALGAPIAVVAGMHAFGLVDFDAALDCTMSWQVLVGATVVGALALRLTRSGA